MNERGVHQIFEISHPSKVRVPLPFPPGKGQEGLNPQVNGNPGSSSRIKTEHEPARSIPRAARGFSAIRDGVLH